jgi:hypothetical protein
VEVIESEERGNLPHLAGKKSFIVKASEAFNMKLISFLGPVP